jgi:hypothetical protein
LSALLISCIAALAHAASSVPRGTQDSRISVTAVAGAVAVTMAGQPAPVEPESTVLLPARIVTGKDGTIGLTQAGTNINVSNDTDVEIPAEAVDGNLIARLVQHRGNVFYDVAPRDVGKLRVETPLLVAVIKGTQFNVAVLESSTTISLFEGQLEIRTPDGSDVVQLNAGEIAIRSLTDNEIRVVGMDDERVLVPGATEPAVAAAVDGRLDAAFAAEAANGVALLDNVEIAAGARVDAAAAKPLIELGSPSAEAALDTGIDLAAGTVDLGLAVDVGVAGAGAGVGLDTGVDLGSGSVDVGLDAGIDLGAASVDLGLDSGVDLGAGSVDVALDTGVDLGAAVVDLGLDAGLDLGSADAGLDAGVDLGGVIDTSVDASVDLGAGTVDLGVDLGGVLDVGLDVDLAGGTIDLGLTGGTAPSAPAAPPPPPRGGLGGLLGGLL